MARFCKPIQVTNKALTKKGRLKGKNKKETKALKNACMHHKINRKGKLKPAYFIQDNDCTCLSGQIRKLKELLLPIRSLMYFRIVKF